MAFGLAPNQMTDIGGNGYRMGASQIYASPAAQPGFTFSNGAPSSSVSSGLSVAGGGGGTGSLPERIPTPDLKPFAFSTEAQSYPTYLRNLGEQNAQRAYQNANNRIGMGNSAQNYAHSLDALNTNRLGYMAQAGQEQLGVDKALQSESDFMNQMYGDLFKTNVGQRGQDTDYLAALARINAATNSSGGGFLKPMGGDKVGNSQLAAFLANGSKWGSGGVTEGQPGSIDSGLMFSDHGF